MPERRRRRPSPRRRRDQDSSVTTTATFNTDSTGKCRAGPGSSTCDVGVTAQADGFRSATATTGGVIRRVAHRSFPDQQNAGFGYAAAGTYRPTVRVTNTNTGQSVYASPGAIEVYRVLPPPVEISIGSKIGNRRLFVVNSVAFATQGVLEERQLPWARRT
ncbi:MAG: hypothetical protein WKG07_23765 [Hymenobacter sp.]